MAEQDTPPTRKQLEQIRAAHPEATAAMLRTAGIDDEAWLGAVAAHHERPGGGGYPRGQGEVGQAARVQRDMRLPRGDFAASEQAIFPGLRGTAMV